ncbi:MAG: 3-hydroxyanthranilate 3,4-dioxygenase, partial [Bacteroidota bacterium]|nr:3-hydroxyanthranilate 3,4-dioxygenase [Bacteroidota bacterium]
MAITRPFNFKKWIEKNRHLLKPPVGNQQIYKENDDLIIMIVGGPNSRKDYHYNETEEFYYQIEGNITLKIVEDDKLVDIPINEGEIFLLPPGIPHSPRRGPNTVGLVIEVYRKQGQNDGFIWFCENCDTKLYEEHAYISDIVTQLPPIMNNFFS